MVNLKPICTLFGKPLSSVVTTPKAPLTTGMVREEFTFANDGRRLRILLKTWAKDRPEQRLTGLITTALIVQKIADGRPVKSNLTTEKPTSELHTTALR